MSEVRGDAIEVDIAPAVPGLRFRHFRGADDIAGMHAAGDAARRQDGVIERPTLEAMRNHYAHPTTWDPMSDIILAEVDDAIVAYGRVEWSDQNNGSRAYESFCLMDPAFRRRGIGRAMLRWQETRLLEIAAGQSTDRPRILTSFAFDADAGAGVLLLSEEYTVIRRDAEMQRPTLNDIPEAPAPAGIELRLGRAEEARAVWDADVEIFRDHWGAVDDSEAAYARFGADPHFDPSLWVVAWDGSEIAGHSLNSLHADEASGGQKGYLDSVGVRRPWRRRGVGRAVVAASLRLLRDRGASSAGLGVDLQNDNRAAHLYETLGFEIANTSTEYGKPLVL